MTKTTVTEDDVTTTCGDCIEGRCHWGGERSRASIALAEKGVEYVDPEFGRVCGCSRHAASVKARGCPDREEQQ